MGFLARSSIVGLADEITGREPGTPSTMREETFASAVDVAYGCGNPNINHD